MKKFLLALLAGVMLLTSCSSDNVPADSGEPQTSDTVSSEETPTDGSLDEKIPTDSSLAKVTIDGTKFMVNGNELWINGVNTPWQNWNDFNGNMDEEFWDGTFAQLKSDNINCTRIWINCNGMETVRLTPTGKLTGINEDHWSDLDKLFVLAEKHQIYLMPTLLSFDHFKSKYWQSLMSDKELIDAYVEEYVVEFAKRYGDNPYLFGIDLMNEPDWVHENDECGKFDWENICYMFAKSAAAIHENSAALVTVGMGIIKYNSNMYQGNVIADDKLCELAGDDNAYIDFYSTHFYAWEMPYFGNPFSVTPEEYGIAEQKPIVIGETSNDDESETGMSCKDKYLNAYELGYNGVMAWMEYRADGSSGCDSVWYRYDLTKEATDAIAELIPEKVFPLGNS